MEEAGRTQAKKKKKKEGRWAGKSGRTPSVKSDGKRSGTRKAAAENVKTSGEKLSGGGGK